MFPAGTENIVPEYLYRSQVGRKFTVNKGVCD